MDVLPWRLIARGRSVASPAAAVAFTAEQSLDPAKQALQDAQLPVDYIADRAFATAMRLALTAFHAHPPVHGYRQDQDEQHQQPHGEATLTNCL